MNHSTRMTTPHQDDREPVPGQVDPRSRAAIPLAQRTGAGQLRDGVDSESRASARAPPRATDAILAPLGANQLEALREIGSEWGSGFDADTGSLLDELEATTDGEPGALDPQTVGRRLRRAVLGPMSNPSRHNGPTSR
jgi:hypothetical protein